MPNDDQLDTEVILRAIQQLRKEIEAIDRKLDVVARDVSSVKSRLESLRKS